MAHEVTFSGTPDLRLTYQHDTTAPNEEGTVRETIRFHFDSQVVTSIKLKKPPTSTEFRAKVTFGNQLARGQNALSIAFVALAIITGGLAALALLHQGLRTYVGDGLAGAKDRQTQLIVLTNDSSVL